MFAINDDTIWDAVRDRLVALFASSATWLHCTLLALSLFPGGGALAADAVEHELIVGYAEAADATAIAAIEAAYGLTLVSRLDLIHARHYRYRPDRDFQQLQRALLGEAQVLHVDKNYRHTPEFIPDDPAFSQQWYLHNTGQAVNGVHGSGDADVDMPEALDIYDGTDPVVVAVVDTGVALAHPELAAMLWSNPLEAVNGIDDDHNGFIDDIHGWNFIHGDADVEDVVGHGTLVASVIAGIMNNAEGGAGLAPNVQIMPLRVCEGNCTSVNIIKGLDYAAQNRARIVNASLTGLTDVFVNQAISELGQHGILFVAAAGNGGLDRIGDDIDAEGLFHPDYYHHDNAIAVAASDQSDRLAAFSNYGLESVDVAAPGDNIYYADVNRTVHLQDGFENGLSQWTSGHEPASSAVYDWRVYTDSSGNHWLTDSLDAVSQPVDYAADTDAWVKTGVVRLGLAPRLKFSAVYELANFADVLLIEASTDDTTWYRVGFVTGSSGTLCLTCDPASARDFDYPIYTLEGKDARFRFRLMTDSANQSDGVYIDNVRIVDVLPFAYDGTQYQYGSGTSYAAPVVSGIAALLWSQRPDLSYAFIRQIILETVDKKPSLSRFVRSGGRVNAHSALALARTFNTAGQIQFAEVAYTLAEGAGFVDLALTRSQGAEGEVSVVYDVRSASAALPADYAGYRGSVQFADGETTQVISIPVYDDAVDGEDGVLDVVLVSATLASLGPNDTARLIILDNDEPSSGGGGLGLHLVAVIAFILGIRIRFLSNESNKLGREKRK